MRIHKDVYKAIRKYPEAYDEGMQAYFDGLDGSACKYSDGSPQRIAWRAGFLGAC